MGGELGPENYAVTFTECVEPLSRLNLAYQRFLSISIDHLTATPKQMADFGKEIKRLRAEVTEVERQVVSECGQEALNDFRHNLEREP